MSISLFCNNCSCAILLQSLQQQKHQNQKWSKEWWKTRKHPTRVRKAEAQELSLKKIGIDVLYHRFGNGIPGRTTKKSFFRSKDQLQCQQKCSSSDHALFPFPTLRTLQHSTAKDLMITHCSPGWTLAGGVCGTVHHRLQHIKCPYKE